MKLMSRIRTFAAVALVSTAPAGADNLADLIPNLFNQTIQLAPPPPGFPSHEAHFVDEQDRLQDTGILLNQSLVSQLATFPLGSSAGGFMEQAASKAETAMTPMRSRFIPHPRIEWQGVYAPI